MGKAEDALGGSRRLYESMHRALRDTTVDHSRHLSGASLELQLRESNRPPACCTT